MKVLNEYPNSHHYIDVYEPSDLFCPHCGNDTVWQEQSPGDYYTGPDYICTTCEMDFSIQGPEKSEQPNMQGKLKQLQSGVTSKPTTPKGH